MIEQSYNKYHHGKAWILPAKTAVNQGTRSCTDLNAKRAKPCNKATNQCEQTKDST